MTTQLSKIFLILNLLPLSLCSSAPEGFFKYFPNRYFVETGSCGGEGIQQALSAGFAQIDSVEIDEPFYLLCKEKFAPHSHINLWLGDSATTLEQMIAPIDQPITFWLDGHWSGGAMGHTRTPLIQELDAIGRHPIKTHTILIDDVRCFGTSDFDYLQLETAIQKIMEINPSYHIRYMQGHKANDILVAQVRQ